MERLFLFAKWWLLVNPIICIHLKPTFKKYVFLNMKAWRCLSWHTNVTELKIKSISYLTRDKQGKQSFSWKKKQDGEYRQGTRDNWKQSFSRTPALHFFTTQKLGDAFEMQYVNYYRANRHLSIYISYVHHPIKNSENFRKSPCLSLKSIITLLSSICPQFFSL